MQFMIESLPVDPRLADEWVPAGVWVLSDERDECVVRYAEDDAPAIAAAARAKEIVRAAWYRLSLMTYNLLSAFKRIGLPEKLHQVGRCQEFGVKKESGGNSCSKRFLKD